MMFYYHNNRKYQVTYCLITIYFDTPRYLAYVALDYNTTSHLNQKIKITYHSHYQNTHMNDVTSLEESNGSLFFIDFALVFKLYDGSK